jgi:hypothetical protein
MTALLVQLVSFALYNFSDLVELVYSLIKLVLNTNELRIVYLEFVVESFHEVVIDLLQFWLNILLLVIVYFILCILYLVVNEFCNRLDIESFAFLNSIEVIVYVFQCLNDQL